MSIILGAQHGIFGSVASAGKALNLQLAGTNLGFETGDFTGWTIVSGSPAVIDTITADEGTYSAQGFWNGDSEIYQEFDVSSYATLIDSDVVTMTFNYAIITDLGDKTAIFPKFLDALSAESNEEANFVWKEYKILRVSSSGWTTQQETFHVPPGTRKVRLHVFFEKDASGTVNNAGIDDIKVYIHSDEPHNANRVFNLNNGDFETGDLTGWTTVSGSWTATTDPNPYGDPIPVQGNWAVFPDVNTTAKLKQEIDVSIMQDAIIAGDVDFHVSMWERGSASDEGRIQAIQKDDVSTLATTNGPWRTPEAWTLFDEDLGVMNTSTELIDVQLDARLLGGGSVLQAYFDYIIPFFRYTNTRTLP